MVSAQQPAQGAGLPLPDVASWAKWVVGSVFGFAIPIYRRILGSEEALEKRVESATEVAEVVAETVKKVASDVAESIPDGKNLRKIILKIEDIADLVIVDAEVVEDFLHEVDEMKEKVEEVIDPIIEEEESTEKGQKH